MRSAYKGASQDLNSRLRLVPDEQRLIADPAAEHTRLKANIEWLLHCFQSDLACPLQSKPILARKAAADACAEGTTVSPRRPKYSLLRNLGPACAHAGRVDHRGPSSARPTHAFRKLFTTAWPLQIFVQLVAAWAYRHKWSVLGERNVWADQLSRGNTSAFDSKPHVAFGFAHMISGPINPRMAAGA